MRHAQNKAHMSTPNQVRASKKKRDHKLTRREENARAAEALGITVHELLARRSKESEVLRQKALDAIRASEARSEELFASSRASRRYW